MAGKPNKQALIRQYMENLGVLHEEAEFMAALELGEIQGDVIIVDEDEVEDDTDDANNATAE